MRRLGCHSEGGNCGRESPCKTKSLNFSLLLDTTSVIKFGPPVPPLISDHIFEKIGSFQTNFTKHLAGGVHFQQHNWD